MVVEPIVPEEPTTKEEEKEVLSVETSNPVGAVMVIPASISTPETVKLSEADAVPEHPENAERLPLVEMVGVGAEVVNEIVEHEEASPTALIGTTFQ